MTSIRDVAKLAGVSPSTVSRAVSYTHLDVYKRQASQSMAMIDDGEIPLASIPKTGDRGNGVHELSFLSLIHI